jgi:hypothetical protein
MPELKATKIVIWLTKNTAGKSRNTPLFFANHARENQKANEQ